MKISYAICVCTEARELHSLLSFLIRVKEPEDDINILVDTKHVTPQVYQVLDTFKDSIVQFSRDFGGDFSAHRNYQLSKCTGDYIFTIDADEIPQEALIKNVRKIIDETDGDLFLVPRINICPGYTVEWLKKRSFLINELGWINWPDYQGRIYKNHPSIKYDNKLHERIVGVTRPVRLDANPQIALWHIKTVEKQDLQDALYKDIQP
jgi:glycosyltransferase involved in cell wall biosynthesis